MIGTSITALRHWRDNECRANSIWIESFDFVLNIPREKIEKRAGKTTLL